MAAAKPEFDPVDHIDRKAEQELFRDLVSFTSSARMLTICDRGDQGKSSLLKRLEYNCQYEIKPSVPACLIALNQLQDTSEYSFVMRIVEGFKGKNVSFDKVLTLTDALLAENFDPFDKSSYKVHVNVSATDVQNGAKVIGQNIERPVITHAEFNVARKTFSDDQVRYCRERCIEAFFEDLRVLSAANPLVLLLDGWERCNSELQRWIIDELLANHCFNPNNRLRPSNLAIVLTSRPYDPANEHQGLRKHAFKRLFRVKSEYRSVVKSLNSLSEWEPPHIKAFLKQNGFHVDDTVVKMIQKHLRANIGLTQALEIAAIVKKPKR